jgi:hypothetical protein
MNIHLSLAPLISLIAGILILIMPRLLNFIVAIYLIAIGLIGLFGASNFRITWTTTGRCPLGCRRMAQVHAELTVAFSTLITASRKSSALHRQGAGLSLLCRLVE